MDSILKNKVLVGAVSVAIIGGVAFAGYSLLQSDKDGTENSSQTAQTNDRNQEQSSAKDQTVEGRLVDGFPGDKIPLYLGDVVESKRSTNSFGKAEYSVSIQTSDDIQKAGDRLETSYMNEGWDIRSEPVGNMFVSHSEEFIVTVSYGESDGGTLINYGITTK